MEWCGLSEFPSGNIHVTQGLFVRSPQNSRAVLAQVWAARGSARPWRVLAQERAKCACLKVECFSMSPSRGIFSPESPLTGRSHCDARRRFPVAPNRVVRVFYSVAAALHGLRTSRQYPPAIVMHYFACLIRG